MTLNEDRTQRVKTYIYTHTHARPSVASTIDFKLHNNHNCKCYNVIMFKSIAFVNVRMILAVI